MTSTIFDRSYTGVQSRTDLAVSSSRVSGQLSAEGGEGGREGGREGGGREGVRGGGRGTEGGRENVCVLERESEGGSRHH